MKTFYDIIQDVSNLRWSIDDPEPESFAETSRAVKLAIPQAHSYIWGLADFPFKKKKKGIAVQPGMPTVLAPEGNIVNVRIDGNGEYLIPVQAEEAELWEEKKGEPRYFWVEFTDQSAAISLYPVPDKALTLIVRYETNFKARDSSGNVKFNLEAMGDVLNLPNDRSIEDLYLHCLYTKSMVYLIADETDENYVPYQREFEEAYRSLLNLTGIKRETRLVI